MIKKILFIGEVPNPVDKYKGVFFQNLIIAMADSGIECTIVDPISITHYGKKIKKIPLLSKVITPKGNTICVHFPRYISYSAKKLFLINTGRWTERSFQRCAMNEVKKMAKQGYSFDSVYGHFFLQGGLAAVRIGKLFSKPSFVAFGECDYESQVMAFYGDLESKDIIGLSGVICVSSNNFRFLSKKEIFASIPMIVAPNSVDHSIFHKMDKKACRRHFGFPEEAFIVSFVGGLIERKGDKRLLEAIDTIDKAYVVFAGVPMHGEPLPAGEKVLFCQPIKHEEVPLFIGSSDVFCLPTLSEGSCNAVVEAMSCGVPVISSDLPFNDDSLDSTNSIRVDPTSIEQIRDAIVLLKNNVNLRTAMGEKALFDSKKFEIFKRAEKILLFMNSISK